MGNYEYYQLGEWAKSFYSQNNNKAYTLACEAFSYVPKTYDDIDLTLDNLEEILNNLPIKLAKNIYQMYLLEKNKYVSSQSDAYDKEVKKIRDAFKKLESMGIRSAYIRNGGHAVDYNEAKSQLQDIIVNNHPSKCVSYNIIRLNGLKHEYYPSHEMEELIDLRNSFIQNKKFNIVSSIDEVVSIDKNIHQNMNTISLISRMNIDTTKQEIFAKTIKFLNEISESLNKNNNKLMEQKNKKIERLEKLIEMANSDSFNHKNETISEKTNDNGEITDFDIRHNISLEKIHSDKTMTDEERQEEIYKMRSKIKDLQLLQSRLKEKKILHYTGEPFEDNVPSIHVHKYETITDEKMYNQYQWQIDHLKKEIQKHEEAPLREEEEQEEKRQREIEKKNEEWSEAYSKFQELSTFKKAIITLKGKHPRTLKNNDYSSEEIRNLYR